MITTALKSLHENGSRPSTPVGPRRREPRKLSGVAPYQKRRWHRPRRRHDPMLVFNMSIFNSANVRQCIFNSLPQRENVW